MSTAPLVERIDADLRAAGEPDRAVREKAYLKSDLTHYGVPVPTVRAIAKRATAARPDADREGLLALVRELWDGDVYEHRALAVELLRLRGKDLTAADLAVVEDLLRRSYTWALVDHLAEKVAGDLLVRFPELGPRFDAWARDDDFWLRRSALLALLGPLRAGGGDWERFTRYADAMLDETEFFIRKAIGWILRDTGKKRPDLVYAWLLPRAARASGVTVREAVKSLPAQQRERIEAARG